MVKQGRSHIADAKGQRDENAANTSALFKPVSARGQATRQRLLDSAEECFAEFGYARTAVAEIVRRSGVAQGSFYVYFPSKRAIFEELINHISHEIRRVTIVAAKKGSRLEAEIAGTMAFLDWLPNHRDLHRLLHLIDEVDPHLAVEFYSSIAEGYTTRLAEAMGRGEAQTVNPELLAFALMGMVHFVSMRWILWPDGGEMDADLRSDYAAVISGALLGADSALAGKYREKGRNSSTAESPDEHVSEETQ